MVSASTGIIIPLSAITDCCITICTTCRQPSSGLVINASGWLRGSSVPSARYRLSAKTSLQQVNPIAFACSIEWELLSPYKQRDASISLMAVAITLAMLGEAADILYRAPCGFTWFRETPKDCAIFCKRTTCD